MKYFVAAALIIVGIASAIYLQPNDQEIIADKNNTAMIAAPYSQDNGAVLINTSPCATTIVTSAGPIMSYCSTSTGTVSISGGTVTTGSIINTMMYGNKTYVDGQLFNVEEKKQ